MAVTIGQSAPAVFASVDSAPGSFAAPVSVWQAPKMLAAFTLLAAVQVYSLNHGGLHAYFPTGDYVLDVGYTGTQAIGFRAYALSFLISFAMFWGRDVQTSTRLLVDFLPGLILIYLCGDLVLGGIMLLTGLQFSLHVIEVISGLIAWGWFARKMLLHATLPREITLRRRATGFARDLGLGVALLLIAILLAHWVEQHAHTLLAALRQSGLIGGLGPGVFLVLPLFFLMLYAVARVRHARMIRSDGFTPDVTIIVPAFNEEYIIARTIRALDSAAEGYAGNVTVLLIDNNSRDATAAIAEASFATSPHIIGKVIREGTPGKAHALNTGLRLTETDYLVRVDADTQILPGSIARALSWFANPRMGVVGGLPLVPGTGPFDSARQIETLVKHGFYSIALQGVHSVVGVPGMLAVYRTEIIRELGGFVSGMNGEDTDISMRIGELGYDIMVDPRIRYISEVPVSLEHLREQRLRWFRSVLHISSRGRQMILGHRATMRGRVILPYMLFNSARRTAMIPLIIYGILEYFLGSGPLGLMMWQPLVAVMLSASALVAVLACLLAGMPRAILGLPSYISFRLLRGYFTLESMLTIRVNHDKTAFALTLPRDE